MSLLLLPSHLFLLPDSPTTDTYTLSLHDALPIFQLPRNAFANFAEKAQAEGIQFLGGCCGCNAAYIHAFARGLDRKSTRLNSSHVSISYAVFCLKKKISLQMPTSHAMVNISSTSH